LVNPACYLFDRLDGRTIVEAARTVVEFLS